MRQIKLPESLKTVFAYAVGVMTFVLIGVICTGAYLVLRFGAIR